MLDSLLVQQLTQLYPEKISIIVTSSGNLATVARDMYVGASDSVDFQISVMATPYMEMQTLTLSAEATVEEINGSANKFSH